MSRCGVGCDVSARVVPEQRRQDSDIVGNDCGLIAGERDLHLGAHVRQFDLHHAGSGGRGARVSPRTPGGMLHGPEVRARLPQPRSGSRDADRDRASELQHAIEGMDSDLQLGCAALVLVRAQPVPVLWSGTHGVRPSRPMMEPIRPSVWRSARRNTARRLSAVRIARGEYQAWPPAVVRGAARQPAIASSMNQTVRLPRWRRLAS